jgi:hypothetical protein
MPFVSYFIADISLTLSLTIAKNIYKIKMTY